MATILFDLDGTLLPMDQDKFIKTYFGLLGRKVAAHGYDPHAVLDVMGKGTYAMIKNDGSMTNEHRFWQFYEQQAGVGELPDKALFESFYANEFQQARDACGFHPAAREIVKMLRDSGHRVVLATNPLFPKIATYHRIRWAGLSPDDFELYTTYEDYRFCKPSLGYYREILEKIGEQAENCIMVGNDVGDDMVAEDLGMRVFLLTDCLINEAGKDLSVYSRGGFHELKMYFADQLK